MGIPHHAFVSWEMRTATQEPKKATRPKRTARFTKESGTVLLDSEVAEDKLSQNDGIGEQNRRAHVQQAVDS